MADRLSEVNGAIENMAATAQESAAGSQEITGNVHGTSAATVQIVQAAQGQAQLAEKLNHMVMKFKIV